MIWTWFEHDLLIKLTKRQVLTGFSLMTYFRVSRLIQNLWWLEQLLRLWETIYQSPQIIPSLSLTHMLTTGRSMKTVLFLSPSPSLIVYQYVSTTTLKSVWGQTMIIMIHAALAHNQDRLFFLAHNMLSVSVYKWHLSCLTFKDMVSVHPNCLQEGKLLVNLYSCCLRNNTHKAANQ